MQETNGKLAYLVSRYPAISHTFILREIRMLRELGWDIAVASINRPDRGERDLSPEEREEFHRTYYVKEAGWKGALRAHLAWTLCRPVAYFKGLRLALQMGKASLPGTLRCLFYFVEAVMIGQWMRRNGNTHLHVHFASQAATAALLLSKMSGTAFSITVHGPDEFYDVTRHFLEQKIEAAAFLCAIGRFAQSQLMKLSAPEHWGKIEVSPLGVDPDEFRPVGRSAARSELNVVCVGRLTPAKGQAILLRAFRELRAKDTRLKLHLVGDGPDRKGLERYVTEQGLGGAVQFWGATPAARVRELLAAADLFVLPSFAEGIPVALMEAMAMEVPCISTNITGIPELIESNVNGLLVMPSDCEALTEAMEKLAGSPDLRKRLGEAGRRKIIRDYNLKANVERLAAVFRKRISAPLEASPGAAQVVGLHEKAFSADRAELTTAE